MDYTPLIAPIIRVLTRFEFKAKKLKTKYFSEFGFAVRYRYSKPDDEFDND